MECRILRCKRSAVVGRTSCEHHLIKQRRNQAALRQRRKLNGLCTGCGRQKQDGHCDYCSTMCKERAMDLQAHGICVDCASAMATNGLCCAECARKRADRSAARTQEHASHRKCTRCGGQLDNDSKQCNECSATRRAHHLALKMSAITAYGKICKCCAYSDVRALTIDHINGDGAAHRRANGIKCPASFYRWLQLNQHPAGFQTLCYNCNHAKGTYKTCPHQEKRILSAQGERRLRLKIKVFDHYGATCVHCNLDDITFLTLDHIANDGNKQRSEAGLKASGSAFYYWLQRNDYPSIVQVLCMNCNFIKSQCI